MDFAPDSVTAELAADLADFLTGQVLPAEAVADEQVSEQTAAGRPFARPPVMAELQAEARARGLWNLFLPDLPDGRRLGAGLTTLQYAPLAELTGRSPHLAPEALNCAAPDTGNMELLAHAGSPEQQERWLVPLLAARIRSAFCMTEPDVASSDATNIRLRARRDGDGYVLDGRKWWSTGAMDPACELLVVMALTALNEDGTVDPRRRWSMLLVPRDTPGVRVVRPLLTFGMTDAGHGGHAEVVFEGARVPGSALLGAEGEGFALAQARLGPGRIHHCMRLIGTAERALELMCRRAVSRRAFGQPLAQLGATADRIADARVAIEQARLLVLRTAWLIDTAGAKAAHTEIQAIKIAVPAAVQRIVDDAIQVHGGAGLCQDTVLPQLWLHARALRLADGPDEVHRASLARRELRRYE
ncbi:MAG: acyl-CoA dehydrogenase family protein [Actinomycetales bacterium]